MGLLAAGQAMLQRVMAAEGHSGTYTRGAVSRDVSVMITGPEETVAEAKGRVTQFGEEDLCLSVAELAGLFPPLRGDLITLTIGTVDHRWRVSAGKEGRLFDWLDARRSRIAIHGVYDGVAT